MQRSGFFMFERVLVSVLTRVLGKYVRNLQTDALRLSLLAGPGGDKAPSSPVPPASTTGLLTAPPPPP